MRADIQDGLHLEVLDMRAHVWGVEQDLQKVVKTGQSLLPLELNWWLTSRIYQDLEVEQIDHYILHMQA